MASDSEFLTHSAFTARQLLGFGQIVVCAAKPAPNERADILIYFLNPDHPERVNGALECAGALEYEARKVDINQTNLSEEMRARANSKSGNDFALRNTVGHVLGISALKVAFAGDERTLQELSDAEAGLGGRLAVLKEPGARQQVLEIQVPAQRTQEGQAALVAGMCGKLCVAFNNWFMGNAVLVEDPECADVRSDVEFAAGVLKKFFADLYSQPTKENEEARPAKRGR